MTTAAHEPASRPRPLPLPPGPRPRYPGAFALALARDRLGFLRRVAAEFPDAARITIGRQHVLLVTDPELVRDVLVTNGRRFAKGRGLEQARRLLGDGLLTAEGERHLRHRRLAQPAFHRERVAAYAAVMSAYASRHVAAWRPGQTMDAAAEMARLTLAIAGKTLFDADVEEDAATVGEALRTALDAFAVTLQPFGELLEWLPFGPYPRFAAARARLDAIIYRIIAERRADPRDRGDLLSMLLAARDEEGDGAGLDDEQLRDEVMTLLLAGHETTANALAWTWWLLATHPDVEARLHAEVDAVLGDRAAGADDLPRLPWVRQVVSESMRLYPPAWVIGRRAIEPYRARDWEVPAGTLLLLPQFVVHRDPRWWPDPERFDPERWTPAAQAGRPKLAYFPFGAGTRVCIGEGFAWTELVLVTATIARRWRLRPLSPEPPALEALVTLRPKGGMPMRVEPR